MSVVVSLFQDARGNFAANASSVTYPTVGADLQTVRVAPHTLAFIQDVKDVDGAVSAHDARRFLQAVFIAEGDAALFHLPLETKLNLYEAVASENHPGNDAYLTVINQALGLTRSFYEKRAQHVDQYFRQGDLEQQWSLKGNPGSFADVIHKMVVNDLRLTKDEKKAAVVFLAQTYVAFSGEDEPIVKFYTAESNDHGYHRRNDNGRSVIGINVTSEAFLRNPVELVNVVIHEIGHQKQISLGLAFRNGEIQEGHPDYTHARVFAANLLSGNGYVSPKGRLGHGAYAIQAAEISSNIDGERAVQTVKSLYGNAPQNVVAFGPVRRGYGGPAWHERIAAAPLAL
jgi:hypothetical protein